MPLVRCPDCLSAVSDQAPVCPHCGRPLHPRKLPDDLEQLSCALVLEEADFNDPNLAALLGELMGCAEEEAATLRGQTPLVVQRAAETAYPSIWMKMLSPGASPVPSQSVPARRSLYLCVSSAPSRSGKPWAPF